MGWKRARYYISLAVIVMLTVNFTCAFGLPTRESIEKKRTETKNKIKLLKRLEFLEANKLQRNQIKLENNQNKLEISKRQYNYKKTRIDNLQQELTETINDYIDSQNSAKDRVVAIYKHQNANLLLFLLSSSDLNYFLDRMYYQNLVTKQDKEELDKLRAKSKRIKLLKSTLEQERRNLANMITTMDRQNKSIQKAIDSNESIIEKYKKDRLAYEKAERELAKQSESLSSMIAKTTSNSTAKVTTAFDLPLNGRFSSPFGWRTHPIFKSKSFHSGQDIAAPMGTAIKASNDGKVIYSGWYGGYGKVVIIDHGKLNGHSITTLYAHMSVQKAHVGEQVKKGQVIGLVGSTGYSTGPHCHFEVRVDGKPVNPLSYVK